MSLDFADHQQLIVANKNLQNIAEILLGIRAELAEQNRIQRIVHGIANPPQTEEKQGFHKEK